MSASATDLRVMERALAAIGDNEPQGDGEGTRDDAFHLAIAAASQNPHLERFVAFLRYQCAAARAPVTDVAPHGDGEPGRVRMQHVALPEAIRARDAETARDVATAHLHEAIARLGRRSTRKLLPLSVADRAYGD